MDGSLQDSALFTERRRRLAAERTLEHTRRELSRAHAALVSNADRMSRRYLAERDQNLKLTRRQEIVLAQRKAAAEEADRARRRLWHALESMRDGFAVYDSEGTMIAANSVYLGLFEGETDLGPGAHATEIFARAGEEGTFDIGNAAPDAWAAAFAERWSAAEIEPLTLRHFDGRVLKFQDRRSADGDIVSVVVDVSEQRIREAELMDARDVAEEDARARAEFLARMSHEFRTPMNGVLGMSEMLIEQAADEDSRTCARTIRDSAEALLVIVNDTLDVSRLEAGEVDLRAAPFDLEKLLCDCLRLASALAKPGVNLALSYAFDAPARFVGDEGRIRQVLMNLLGNAAKFTEAGRILLSCAVAEADPAEVTISIEDTGCGIEPAERLRIFDAFAQTSRRKGAPQEGTGLGLTISRGIATQMGGRLDLDDKREVGARFVLSLPLPVEDAQEALPPMAGTVTVGGDGGAPEVALRALLAAAGAELESDISAETTCALLLLGKDHSMQTDLVSRLPPGARLVAYGNPALAAPDVADRADAVLRSPAPRRELLNALAAGGTASRAAHRPRLLLADDNATNRLLLERMLKNEPFDVELVADGSEALAAARRARPDAVVLDISMPVVDGFEAAVGLRALPGPDIPLLALTAHVGNDMAERLTSAGFMAHLTKPIRKDDLLAALSAALSPAEPRNAP